MTGSNVHPAEEGWSWVRRRLGEEGACLTFVDGVSAEQLLGAYGMNVTSATMMTFDQALTRFPEYEQAEPGKPVPWVRVGASDNWAFAVEPASLLGSRSVVGPTSEGTRAAVVQWSPEPSYWLAYYEDRTCIVEFEPRMEWSLHGSDPHRFRSQIQELGILDRPQPAPRLESGKRDMEALRRQYRDPVIQMLGFLTHAFGIQVSEETATGPLLTCQRGTDPR